MGNSGNLRRVGTLVGLFSSGAAVGILTDRNVPLIAANPFIPKPKLESRPPVIETKEGKIWFIIL